MYINCAGMMRSGSTLQYNIVVEILELKGKCNKLGWVPQDEFFNIKNKCKADKYNVFKNHFLTDEILAVIEGTDESCLMYVHRDIRDVCVSVMEKENKSFDFVFSSNVLHNAIEQYYKVLNSGVKKYCQSYEVMFLNAKKEILNISKYLGTALDVNEIDYIFERVSFDAQLKRIDNYKVEKNYVTKNNQCFNPETLLHLNHIKDGCIGKYKSVLNSNQIKDLEDEFGGWLLENGYKLDTKKILNIGEPFRRYYSQHGEDFLLWNYFDYKQDGFFIEVGAFDGIHLSNTYSFERQGWKGICIEPSEYFDDCKRNRENSICLNVACVADEGITESVFYQEKLGLLSSLEMSSNQKEDIAARYEVRNIVFDDPEERVVACRTLNNILASHNVEKIDFISIDVEGGEMGVLKGLDLKRYRPEVLIIEANNDDCKSEIVDYLTVENDYVFARQTFVNLFFIRKSSDFYKIRNIDINCTIEKQSHPLGKKYTLLEFFYGFQLLNGVSLKKQFDKVLNIVRDKDNLIAKKNLQIQEKSLQVSNYHKVFLKNERDMSRIKEECANEKKVQGNMENFSWVKKSVVALERLCIPMCGSSKIAFLHIPKTAGGTVSNIIYKTVNKEFIYDVSSKPSYEYHISKIKSATDLNKYSAFMGHYSYKLAQYFPSDVKYFTLLRSPVERVLSFYEFAKRTKKHYLYDVINSNNYSILDCIDNKLSLEFDNYSTRMLAGVDHHTDQLGDAGKLIPFGLCNLSMLEEAINNLNEKFIFVGVQENMGEAVEFLRCFYDRKSVEFTSKNVNSDKSYRDKYDKETLLKIEELNTYDELLYSYVLDGKHI